MTSNFTMPDSNCENTRWSVRLYNERCITCKTQESLPGRNWRTKMKTFLDVLWTNTATLHKTHKYK